MIDCKSNQPQIQPASEKPLGTHLICPVCGLLRINHDCEAETEKKKKLGVKAFTHVRAGGSLKREVYTKDGGAPTGVEAPLLIKPKKYKPYKSKFLRCYGLLLDNGKFDTQFFARGDYAFVLPFKSNFMDTETQKSEYLNVRERADWLSVSAYKNARHGRTEENISHVLCGFLDLDGDKLETPLTDAIIKHRCKLLELPTPKTIETSPHRYQIKFYYIKPESIKNKWKIKAAQEGLHEAFKDLGSDPQAALDLTRFLRNEYLQNAINKKYNREHKPKVTVVEKGELCTLDQLYRTLKKHGYIKEYQKWRTKFSPNFTPLKDSRSRLIAFLKSNPRYVSTIKELAQRLLIPIRTLKLVVETLKKQGKLTTELVGRWSERKTVFITHFFEVHIKEYFNNYSDVCTPTAVSDGIVRADVAQDTSLGKQKKEPSKVFSQALDRAKAGGLPHGVRDLGVFILALWLNTVKKVEAPEEIILVLEPIFMLVDSADPVFSHGQFEKCVYSACRDRYRFCMSASNYKAQLVFDALGLC